jgi:hypothetical protein
MIGGGKKMMRSRIARILLALAYFPASATQAIPVTTAKSANATLREHDADFKACHDENFKRSKKNAYGRVNLRIVIDKSGKILEVGPAKNTTRSRFIADCVTRVAEGIHFDPQRTKRVLIYPIRFRAPKPSK